MDVGVPVGDIFSAGGEKRLAPMDGEELAYASDESGSLEGTPSAARE